MEEQIFILEFEGVSKADANKYATELQPLLKNATQEANVKTRQADENSQAIGATLIISILSTPAVITLIEVLFNYLQKRRSGKITLKTDEGELVAENLGSNDLAALTDKWMSKLKK